MDGITDYTFKKSLFGGYYGIMGAKRFGMKKFYVSPIFPLILGIVAFGVLSVQLVFVTNTLVTLFLLLLILGSYILLFIHQRDYILKSEVEQIQYVNHQAEESLTNLVRTDACRSY